MFIDCDGCAVRGLACGDCVVTLLLGTEPGDAGEAGTSSTALDPADRRALRVLADAGLVPRLRHEPHRLTG
jgi:hypothetical protein